MTALALTAVGLVVALVALSAQVAERRRLISPERFREERKYLSDERPRLTQQAFEAWPTEIRGSFGGMLSPTSWRLTEPLPLSAISVDLVEDDPPVTSHPVLKAARSLLPRGASGRPYSRYSAAMADITPSSPFEDRPCYRLIEADLTSAQPSLRVGRTSYFRAIDEGEALAHEVASRAMRQRQALNGPLRREMDRPFEFAQRNQIFAVSALTLRVASDSTASFYLHSRDPGGVAVAGSLIHLAPSGVFQPCSDDNLTIRRDCDPWLTLCREFAEEFLGAEEAEGDNGAALSYSEPPYAAIDSAYRNQTLRVSVLGMGLDPLTLFAELVVVVCVDAETFDDIFRDMVRVNREGKFRGSALSRGRLEGYRFDDETVSALQRQHNLSPAARAALEVAWRCREQLLD